MRLHVKILGGVTPKNFPSEKNHYVPSQPTKLHFFSVTVGVSIKMSKKKQAQMMMDQVLRLQYKPDVALMRTLTQAVNCCKLWHKESKKKKKCWHQRDAQQYFHWWLNIQSSFSRGKKHPPTHRSRSSVFNWTSSHSTVINSGKQKLASRTEDTHHFITQDGSNSTINR